MTSNSRAGDLQLVRIRLRTPRVIDHGRRRGMKPSNMDTGYAAHCFMRELWQQEAPQPFSIRYGRAGLAGNSENGGGRGAWLDVWGYTTSDAAALRDHAETYGAPELVDGVDLERLSSKGMPLLDDGREVGFSVRICPVVRDRSGTRRNDGRREIDAWLSRCVQVGTDETSRNEHLVEREAVYREWLADRLRSANAADLVSARLRGYQRTRLLRRSQGNSREWRTIDRPDAELDGRLRIADAAAFQQLLARGIGRHRAFGFGMLLLVPPSLC